MEDDIKCILQDKQFHLQLKLEQKEIIQNVLERKDSMAVLPTGFGKSMCYVLLLSHFGQGKIIYANHLPWYIAVIVVTWQMFESESEMAKWEGVRENHAVIECNTTFWGGYEWIEKWLVKRFI